MNIHFVKDFAVSLAIDFNLVGKILYWIVDCKYC